MRLQRDRNDPLLYDVRKHYTFGIKAANWLIAAVLPPIDLEYEKISQRLLRFTGLGQLPNDAGKGQPVDIHYRYPESITTQ